MLPRRRCASRPHGRRSPEKVAAKLCPQWNVFAAYLQNEPHAASWGKGDPGTDWGQAAERASGWATKSSRVRERWGFLYEIRFGGARSYEKDHEKDDENHKEEKGMKGRVEAFACAVAPAPQRHNIVRISNPGPHCRT